MAGEEMVSVVKKISASCTFTHAHTHMHACKHTHAHIQPNATARTHTQESIVKSYAFSFLPARDIVLEAVMGRENVDARCACMHVCLLICQDNVDLCMYGWMDACVHPSIHPCVYPDVRTFVHACMHAFVHTCIYIYIHAYVHRDMSQC